MHVKTKLSDLAILGGIRLFNTPKPIGQLSAPSAKKYISLVHECFQSGRLSDNGPLVVQLEKELSRYHDTKHCIALANAGMALMMLMQIFSGGRQGKVIVPAFSYRGLPHFSMWAKQQPIFCDVDSHTHTLDPDSLRKTINKDVTSILAVTNFNSTGNIESICKIGEENAVPVFFDSVYGIGSTYKGRPLGSFGKAEVFSLHATKLLNGFEGGYITTNDGGLADILTSQRDNNTQPDGLEYIIGLNARLNELHAAMALLNLSNLDETIEQNRIRYGAYQKAIEPIPGLELIPYPDHEKSNYQMAVIEVSQPWPLSRNQTHALLHAEGADISPYYSPPLYKWSAQPLVESNTGNFPVADMLADRYLQLPVGELITKNDIHNIGQLLAFAAIHGKRISSLLKEKGIK